MKISPWRVTFQCSPTSETSILMSQSISSVFDIYRNKLFFIVYTISSNAQQTQMGDTQTYFSSNSKNGIFDNPTFRALTTSTVQFSECSQFRNWRHSKRFNIFCRATPYAILYAATLRWRAGARHRNASRLRTYCLQPNFKTDKREIDHGQRGTARTSIEERVKASARRCRSHFELRLG